MIIFCVSLTNVRHSRDVCRHFKAKFRFSFYTSKPSSRQWSLISYVTSRPSTRQRSSMSLQQDPLRGNGHWFLMSHRGPLWGNGHRSPYIKTLCEAMVIDFLCHIEALCEAMVINLFAWRPSARQWSSFPLHQGPLQGNGHRSLYIKTFCVTMVIDFFVRLGPSMWKWSLNL